VRQSSGWLFATTYKKCERETMTLRQAALLALVGMLILTVLVGFDFIITLLDVSRGLLPAVKVLTSLVHLLASLTVTAFFFVFHRTYR
jgi:hypothetical protein